MVAMGKAVALAALLMLAACQTPQGTFCDIAKPIRLSAEAVDAMSDVEVAAALAHNRKGAAMCAWKP